MKYSAEELRGLGFAEEQIQAIQNTYKRELKDIPVSPLLEKVVPIEVNDNKRAVAHNTELKVTTISDLREYAKGQIVELPPFADGQPLVVRMKRPSLMVLAKSGKIPNNLMKTATALFNGDDMTDGGEPDEELLGKTYDILELLCNAALVEPTLADFKEAGIELSDNQMIAIFNYTQSGIDALNSFRK